MAKQENGHWITYKGKRIFISDDTPRMSGYSPKYGAYQTKEDKKFDIINKMRKLSLELEDPDNPTSLSRSQQSALSEYTRLERRLNKEYGMSEEEIFKAVIKSDEEDLIDKQEREIAEREAQTKQLTEEMRETDFIEGGHDYPEMSAEDIVDGLVEEWQDFSDAGGDGISGDVYAKDDISASKMFSDSEVDSIMSRDFDYSLACKFMAWYAMRDISKPYTKAKVANAINSMVSNGAQLNDKAVNAIMQYVK